jgi:hypothetical protein
MPDYEDGTWEHPSPCAVCGQPSPPHDQDDHWPDDEDDDDDDE